MIPTREQFKEFIAFVKKAQEKEDKVDEAFRLIWDDDQGQYPPFYISPLWDAVTYAFCIMFNQKYDKYEIDDLYWWLENAPKGEAKYWIGDEEHNVSDIDAFYDYLVENAKDSDNKTDEK